ncbi:MAG: 16S rRNA (cytidine(1402)-2'-O)-methyltransferase [Chloroflexota bacterium]
MIIAVVGSLYIVSTPIGNLEDITLRAIRVLREVDMIAAEDTRVTRRLLDAHDVRTPMVSFHEHSGGRRVAELVDRLSSGDVALVSDAGTPGINDPGYPLVAAALGAGYPVVPIPGASAVLAALVGSGLPMHAFCFRGFLPRKAGERRRAFAALAEADGSTVFYESPHRIAAALREAVEVLGPSRPAAVARELTKKFEEIRRGGLADLAEQFGRRTVRGEITLVIGPAQRATRAQQPSSRGTD